MKRKLVSLMLVVSMTAAMVAGCGSDDKKTADNNAAGTEKTDDSKEAASGSVYYLNFKPEQDQQWQDLAKAYTDETGVPVEVVTAASGTYEETLKSEIAKSDAPTLFQVNGPVGLAAWKDYCADLSGTDVYSHVKSDDFVLKDGDEVKGIAYVLETYGLIYNKTVLNAYCGMDGAKVSSIDEINSFAKLKEVADDIQSRLAEVSEAAGPEYDLKGAFTSAGMDSSSDWRFKTHLANLPIYYEYKADGIESTDAIKGTYLDNYKQIWDLYTTDSTCEGSMLASKTGDNATAEFGLGEAVFYQNGTWEYTQLIDGGLTDDDMTMLPVYFGVGDEANQGLCTGTENYWCVNKDADEADIQATLDFMDWCVTSDEGTKCMADDMGFNIPFKKAQESKNLFIKEDKQMTEDGKTPVAWNFSTMPSEEWKNGVGSALTAYAADQTDANWDAVVSAFVDGWASEYKLANE